MTEIKRRTPREGDLEAVQREKDADGCDRLLAALRRRHPYGCAELRMKRSSEYTRRIFA
jgi:hypothetical protein